MKNFEFLESEINSDESLQIVTGQIFAGQAILVAYELGLFNLISSQTLSVCSIANLLGLHERPVQAMISCAGALRLVDFVNNGYTLSQIGKTYLDNKSCFYYGNVFDLLIKENEIMNYSNVKRALLSNKSILNEDGMLFLSHDQVSNTSLFLGALHQKALMPAFAWARNVDLSSYRKFIDIGTGSGIHAIAACLNNPLMEGVACDRSDVLVHTREYIHKFGLQTRIQLHSIDMWEDPFPKGDVFFFGDIFHDWNKEKCVFLAKKAHQSLPTNGHILLHEMLFDENKTGPLISAGYNMKMLAWTEGQQFNISEIGEILNLAGFGDVQIVSSFGNWSLISAFKR